MLNTVLESKNKIQESAIETWIQNDYKGTIVVGTGVGKTRIGLMAIKTAYEEHLRIPESEVCFKALIIVPTTNLRDNEWVNEINKWFPELKKLITIECIQTAYKWGTKMSDYTYNYGYNIIVLDEIHTTISPEYRNIYNNISYDKILGLTATIPHIEEYANFLNKTCPVIYTLNTLEAADLEIVSKFKIYNIEVGFNRKEASKYKTYSKMFTNSMIALSSKGNAFEVAQAHMKDKSSPLQKIAQQFWTGMSLRRWVCYKAESKLQACLDIIHNVPRNKWIIFCASTDIADTLADMLREQGIMAISYHSKIKAKDRVKILENVKSSLCKVIVSAQALNTGYNLPDIDGAICLSSTGTELTFIQTRGRIIRLNDSGKEKVAIFINLYVRNTQEFTWVKNRVDTEAEQFESVSKFVNHIKKQ